MSDIPGSEPSRPDAEGSRLRRLARHLPVFETSGFSFGEWTRPLTDADGVTQIGWFEPSPEAEAFLADAREWVTVFDWRSWAESAEGRSLLEDPAAVASASEEDLAKLLTTFIRSERFGDGTLESAFRRGMLAAILRRAAQMESRRGRTRARGAESGVVMSLRRPWRGRA